MKKFYIIGTLILALIGLRAIDPFPIESMRLKTFDYFISTLPYVGDENILLVDIDDDSLQQLGQWPWPREVFCRFLGPGVTGFSVLFPEEDRFGGDKNLAKCIKKNSVVVSAAASNADSAGRPPHVGTSSIGEDPKPFLFSYKGVLNNVDRIEEAAIGNGVTSTAPEVDNLVRRLPLVFNINDTLYPSFGLEVLRAAAGAKSYTLKTNETGIEALRVKGLPVINTDPNARVWATWNTQFERISAKDYAEKAPDYPIVLLGVTARGASTLVATPDGLKAPHEIQASTISTLLQGKNIARPDWADGAEILALAVILSAIAALAFNLYFSIPALIVAIVASIGYTSYTFSSSYTLLDPSYIIFAAFITWAVTSFISFYTQFKLRQQIKKQFEHYLDPGMVGKLQKNPELLKLGGERKDMTFLFCDIRGFTPISETYKDNPEGLVELINEFLTNQTNIILKHGGTIDKYMGDCIMAFWNAPLDDPKHACHAVVAAIEMRRSLAELNNVLQHERGIEINTGIGINTGPCIVGNMGSDSRFDYSVIGDAVNLASRLEGQCKEFNTDLIISEFTMKQAPSNEYEKLGEVTVKGKNELVSIYTIPKINLDLSIQSYYNT